MPGAVYKDGKIYLYFVDFSGQSKPTGLMVAISSDNGKTFTQQPLQVTGAHTGGLADPAPVLLADGRIRLYYMGPNGPTGWMPSLDTQVVYSAISADGINFTEEAGQRFTYANITDPDVFYTGSEWVMLTSAGGQGLVRATSRDGLTFTYQNQISGSISATVRIGDQFHTFYCSGGGIAVAYTGDGQTWTVGGSVLPGSDQTICDPTVVHLADGTYRMFYKVIVGSGGKPSDKPAVKPGGKPTGPAAGKSPAAVDPELKSPPEWPDSSCVTPAPSTYFRAVHNAGPWGANQMHMQEQPREWFDYLRKQNVNWVGVSPVWHLRSRADDTVFPAPAGGLNKGALQSWSDDDLRRFIRRLRCQGFHVYLALAVFSDSVDGQYHRYEYWPTENFKQSYTEYVLHYARMAEEENVELLGIGTEMDTAIHVSQAEWLKELLRQVRAVYKGAVTYDQHYSAVQHEGRTFSEPDPQYWWQLAGVPSDIWTLDFDYIGLSVYDIAARAGAPNDVADLTSRLQAFFEQVEAAHRKYGKPVLFLEFGQPNLDPALLGKPDTETFMKAPVQAGYQLQTDFFTSFFSIADKYDWLQGGFIWEYWVMSNDECQTATCRSVNFTARGKPAEAVIRDYYAERARREEQAGKAP